VQNFSIEWIKAAKINKNDNGKTISITNDTNFLSLTLNNKKTNVNLEIDDGRTDKFIVKTENGELNIYRFSKIKIGAQRDKKNLVRVGNLINNRILLFVFWEEIKTFMMK